jgi:hypothetical protein
LKNSAHQFFSQPVKLVDLGIHLAVSGHDLALESSLLMVVF